MMNKAQKVQPKSQGGIMRLIIGVFVAVTGLLPYSAFAQAASKSASHQVCAYLVQADVGIRMKQSEADGFCSYYSRDQITCAMDIYHFTGGLSLEDSARYCSSMNEAQVFSAKAIWKIGGVGWDLATQIAKKYSEEQVACAIGKYRSLKNISMPTAAASCP